MPWEAVWGVARWVLWPPQLYDPPRCEEIVLQTLASSFPTAMSSLLWWADIHKTNPSSLRVHLSIARMMNIVKNTLVREYIVFNLPIYQIMMLKLFSLTFMNSENVNVHVLFFVNVSFISLVYRLRNEIAGLCNYRFKSWRITKLFSCQPGRLTSPVALGEAGSPSIHYPRCKGEVLFPTSHASSKESLLFSTSSQEAGIHSFIPLWEAQWHMPLNIWYKQSAQAWSGTSPSLFFLPTDSMRGVPEVAEVLQLLSASPTDSLLPSKAKFLFQSQLTNLRTIHLWFLPLKWSPPSIWLT